ncbi:hypothetical protein WJX72_003874 [[Myrmecia] bisecta]|uniref:C2 NT-type domain-containing protein n=1 Tax=[Myrmecia] bisecta TaxID=41462 RepID=A0AAW1PVK8_9CHLO
MSNSVTRRLTEMKAKALGRQPLRFQVELKPISVVDVPKGVTEAAFAYQRGAKQGRSKAAKTTTLFKDGPRFMAKEYAFKVQRLGADDKRSTFGKIRVDLAQFCSVEATEPREICLPLKPHGGLRISIHATWLRNCQPEQDTMTEISCMSLGPSLASSEDHAFGPVDQDLSGFDDEEKVKALHAGQSADPQPSPQKAAAAAKKPPYAAAGGSLSHRRTNTAGQLQFGATPAKSFTAVDEASMFTPVQKATLGRSSSLPTHRKSHSEPMSPLGECDLDTPLSPASPEDYDTVVKESYATLVTSDEDDDEERRGQGFMSSVGRWTGWTTTKKRLSPQDLKSPLSRSSGALRSATNLMTTEREAEAISKETDVDILRHRCGQALRERDQERKLRCEAERAREKMAEDVKILSQAKAMLCERLSVAEDHLAQQLEVARRAEEQGQDSLTLSLVQTKLLLAQANYHILELKGKNRTLMCKMTAMEAELHAMLDQTKVQRKQTV